MCTVLRPEEHADRPDSAGRPVLFVEARVVDLEGKDVPVGESGEIIYRSPQLCDGYFDNETRPRRPSRVGGSIPVTWCGRDDQGYVFVVDRIKDVINTGGVLVASREIEDAIYTHPAVAEVAVIGMPDEKWVEAVSAFVVRKGDVTEEELIAHLRERLAGFKLPKRVVFIDDLPRNASGKILKRELRDA